MKSFAELTTLQKGTELFRWLLVPVAAAVTVYVLLLFSRVVLPPVMARLPGTPPPPRTNVQIVAPFIFNVLISGALVFVGAKVAPRGRAATALVLAGLWISYSLLIHVYVHLGRGVPNYLHFALSVCTSLAAVALVKYGESQIRRESGTASEG